MKRILVKLSGEGLTSKDKKLAIDPKTVDALALQMKKMIEKGFEVAVVVGGGNFWRGASAAKNGIPRNRADYIGMLATIMNALALQSGFQNAGVPTKVMSSLNVDCRVAENYINEKAIASLENKEVVIFAGGTGRPFFTTDTTATLLASELSVDTILMGKNGVDGIYDSDPKRNKEAKRFDTITFDELVEKNLRVMDSTAAAMARDNDIEIYVFDITKEDAILRAASQNIELTKVVK